MHANRTKLVRFVISLLLRVQIQTSSRIMPTSSSTFPHHNYQLIGNRNPWSRRFSSWSPPSLWNELNDWREEEADNVNWNRVSLLGSRRHFKQLKLYPTYVLAWTKWKEILDRVGWLGGRGVSITSLHVGFISLALKSLCRHFATSGTISCRVIYLLRVFTYSLRCWTCNPWTYLPSTLFWANWRYYTIYKKGTKINNYGLKLYGLWLNFQCAHVSLFSLICTYPMSYIVSQYFKTYPKKASSKNWLKFELLNSHPFSE